MKEVRMYAQKFIDRGKVCILYSDGCYLYLNENCYSNGTCMYF